MKMMIFSHGKEVWYKGRPYTVDYTYVAGLKLFLRFREIPDLVDAEKVTCEPTELELNAYGTTFL